MALVPLLHQINLNQQAGKRGTAALSLLPQNSINQPTSGRSNFRWRPTINHLEDHIFGALCQRSLDFGSSDACGRWNMNLISSLSDDTQFYRAIERFFRKVVVDFTQGECIASDGLIFKHLVIEFGESLEVHFDLHFLDAPGGYGTVPVKIAVVRDAMDKECYGGDLGCGLCLPEGDFWNPKTVRAHAWPVPSKFAWSCTRRFRLSI